MGNLPVVQEVGTTAQVLGDHITGHPERARERVENYYKESVIGSVVAGTVEYLEGNRDTAGEFFKGCGRATGKAVLGGGFMRDVPVFHELAVCGESLGDVIGGGDTESAAKRWETYVESSVIGSGLATVEAKLAGDDLRAAELAQGFVKAGAKCAVAGIGAGAVIATGGLAAGVVVGAGVGATSTAATQFIDKGKVDDIGDVVGNGLFGGTMLGVNNGVSPILVTNAGGVYHRSAAQDAKDDSSAGVSTGAPPILETKAATVHPSSAQDANGDSFADVSTGAPPISENNAATVYPSSAQDANDDSSAGVSTGAPPILETKAATVHPSSAQDANGDSFAAFQKVPPPNVTAKNLITNFLRNDPTHDVKNLTKDIVVVMDGSGSIGDSEFDKGKTALKNMIGLEIEEGSDTKYASVTFSQSATLNSPFLPYARAANEILMITYPSGGTNTQAGLTEAKKLFKDPSSGVRDKAKKMVLLVTDGHSNIDEDLTIPKAEELKNFGVQIFVVAVGSYINGIDELVKVASTPPEQFLFRVESLHGFLQIVQLVIEEIAPGKYEVSKRQ